MEKGIFVNLTATGTSPMYSRIRTIFTADVFKGSSFEVHAETVDTLEQERITLTRLCERLAMRTLIYKDSSALKYLQECCGEYHLNFAPSDILPLCDCIDDIIDMGYDLRVCMAEIPQYTGELKHFYKDYKNYYYLPAEDQAYHKAVSGFVDRLARVQATARTAYTKKAGTFIPVCDKSLVDPNYLFQKDFDSSVFYTLPQYLDLKNSQVIASYMFCPHIPEDV